MRKQGLLITWFILALFIERSVLIMFEQIEDAPEPFVRYPNTWVYHHEPDILMSNLWSGYRWHIRIIQQHFVQLVPKFIIFLALCNMCDYLQLNKAFFCKLLSIQDEVEENLLQLCRVCIHLIRQSRVPDDSEDHFGRFKLL